VVGCLLESKACPNLGLGLAVQLQVEIKILSSDIFDLPKHQMLIKRIFLFFSAFSNRIKIFVQFNNIQCCYPRRYLNICHEKISS